MDRIPPKDSHFIAWILSLISFDFSHKQLVNYSWQGVQSVRSISGTDKKRTIKRDPLAKQQVIKTYL